MSRMHAVFQQLKQRKLLAAGGVLAGYYAYSHSQYSRKRSIDGKNIYHSLLKYQDNKERNDMIHRLKSRDEHIAEIERTQYDTVIIGGGCSGAGAVLEGASRGLKCLLVEEFDFAAGASSKSTKLLHGGVRYLADVFAFSLEGGRKEKFNLVKESLEERSYAMDNAFYLNKKLPLVIPCENLLWAGYYYAALFIYQWCYWFYKSPQSNTSFNWPYIMDEQDLRSEFMYLDSKYKYGIVYYDGQMNDARFNLDILLTSTLDRYRGIPQFKGATVVNYMRFADFEKDEKGQIIGAKLIDKTTDKEIKVKTHSVVNATGVFADRIRKKDNPNALNRIIPVEGSHMTLPLKYGSKKNAILIPETEDGRVLFLIPWERSLLVGTTERKYGEPVINPTSTIEEIAFLAKEIHKICPYIEVSDIIQNIQSKWAGLRPLVYEIPKEPTGKDLKGGAVDTKSVSRKHVVENSGTGLVSVMGGKWTVYRIMGEEAIDEVVKVLREKGIQVPATTKHSGTKFLKLLGSFDKREVAFLPERKPYLKIFSNELRTQYDIPKRIAKYLIKTYGERSFDIMRLTHQDPSLLERVHDKHPYLMAEAAYHIRYELAVSPADVLLRRMRMGLVDQRAMFESLAKVVRLFAKERGWDEQRYHEEYNKTLAELQKQDY